jgi:hypothetical protein
MFFFCLGLPLGEGLFRHFAFFNQLVKFCSLSFGFKWHRGFGFEAGDFRVNGSIPGFKNPYFFFFTAFFLVAMLVSS